MELFKNQTTNANGVTSGMLKGGFSTMFAYGTFGGGTITIEMSPDGVEWFDSGLVVTTKTMANLDVAYRMNGIKIRAVLSGSAGADVTVLAL